MSNACNAGELERTAVLFRNMLLGRRAILVTSSFITFSTGLIMPFRLCAVVDDGLDGHEGPLLFEMLRK